MTSIQSLQTVLAKLKPSAVPYYFEASPLCVRAVESTSEEGVYKTHHRTSVINAQTTKPNIHISTKYANTFQREIHCSVNYNLLAYLQMLPLQRAVS